MFTVSSFFWTLSKLLNGDCRRGAKKADKHSILSPDPKYKKQ